jgi:hypothetical protein
LGAYNTIARSRKYEQGVPLALGANEIGAYLELFESPCELHIFIDCIMAIDNDFLDKAHKRMSKKSA